MNGLHRWNRLKCSEIIGITTINGGGVPLPTHEVDGREDNVHPNVTYGVRQHFIRNGLADGNILLRIRARRGHRTGSEMMYKHVYRESFLFRRGIIHSIYYMPYRFMGYVPLFRFRDQFSSNYVHSLDSVRWFYLPLSMYSGI